MLISETNVRDACHGSTFLGSVLVWLAFVAALSLAFFPIFYVFPDEDVTVRELVPGTVFAAAGWATVETAFQEYVAIAGSNDAYGLLGAVLLLVTWLYVSGLVVLVGPALNAVLAGRSEDVDPIPWNDPGPSPVAFGASIWPWSASSTATDGAGATVDASAPSTTTHDDVPGADAIERAEVVAALADALRDADPDTAARVHLDDDAYALPLPGTVRAETTTVARPGFLGGQETRTTLELVWEHDHEDDQLGD